MAVKQFGVAPATAGEELAPGLVPLPFTLGGGDHVYTAHPPKRASWKRAQLSQRASVPLVRKIEVLVDFLNGCLRSPADADELSDRLLDGTDPLDYTHLLPVVTWLMTSWSAQITQLKDGQPAAAGLEDEETPAAEPAQAQVQVEGPVGVSTPVPAPAAEPQAAPVAAEQVEAQVVAAGLPPVPPAAG